MLNKTLFAAMLAALMLAAPVQAQDAQTTDTPETSAPEDEVISFGTRVQNDPAMSAWNAGDYATAEVEFDKNAFCALRAERGFSAGVQTARDASILGDVFADSVGTPSPTGGPGGVSEIPQAPTGNVATDVRIDNGTRSNRDNPLRRTCEDRGFQVYMKGMSQLKLGKIEDAKDAFYQATNLNRQLYDAHFRLSLLEYQAGDLDKANKEANALRRLQSRCRRCDAKEEIAAQIGYLDQLLGKSG